jgi:putative intracellular protease/amidase
MLPERDQALRTSRRPDDKAKRRNDRQTDAAVLDRSGGQEITGYELRRAGRFKAHAVRDGNLITGQQQYSAKAVARLIIEALGV